MENFKYNIQDLLKLLTPEMEKYFLRKLPGETIETIKLKVVEFLKFCLIPNFKHNVPFNDEIDEIWHLWILQTQQYRELMNALPHKTFLDHSSDDYGDKESLDQKEEINNQISFLATYVYHFGSFTLNTLPFWPFANRLFYKFEKDIDRLNSYLTNLAVKYA